MQEETKALNTNIGIDAILDTALALETVVRERQQTPDAAITAVAMTLGKICAEHDISLSMAQDLVRISFEEGERRRGGQA